MNDSRGFDATYSERPNTLSGRLLGLFVVFQFLVIPLGSYITMIPVRLPPHHGELDGDLQTRVTEPSQCREPIQSIYDATAWTCSRWAELSGQRQGWALFVTFGDRASFPIVELQWPAGDHRATIRLSCHFEPDDPTHYFYWPEPCCRMWCYDNRMVLLHAAITRNMMPDAAAFRQASFDAVRSLRRSTSAYLRWKTDRYLRANPDVSPPEHVTLIARVLPDPRPGESYRDRPAPMEIPHARWWPARTIPADEVPLEAWDPVGEKFVRLKISGPL